MSRRFSWVLALVVVCRLRCADGASRRRRLQPAVAGTRSRPAPNPRAPTPCGPNSPAVTTSPRSSSSPATTAGALNPADLGADQADSAGPGVRRRPGRGGHGGAAGRRSVRVRTQRRGQGASPVRRRRPARRPAGRGHRRPRVRRRYRELVLRSQHHAARGHRRGGGAAADRHLPLAGALAGAAGRDRLRRPGRRRGRYARSPSGRHDPGRVDLGASPACWCSARAPTTRCC